MLKRFCCIAVLFFLSFNICFADAVYLKDGNIIKGKITKETKETITIENENYWKEINKNDIKEIKKEEQEKAEQIKKWGDEKNEVIKNYCDGNNFGSWWACNRVCGSGSR